MINDVVYADATVQDAFFVGFGLNRNTFFGEFSSDFTPASQARLSLCLNLGAMFFDHSLMVFRGNRGHGIWNQIVISKSRSYFDNVTSVSEVIDRLN